MHGVDVAACFWNRGITPKKWTEIEQTQDSRHFVGAKDMAEPWAWDPEIWFEPDIVMGLDGSGGKYSSDPRRRRVGWAWVQVMPIPVEIDPESGKRCGGDVRPVSDGDLSLIHI